MNIRCPSSGRHLEKHFTLASPLCMIYFNSSIMFVGLFKEQEALVTVALKNPRRQLWFSELSHVHHPQYLYVCLIHGD